MEQENKTDLFNDLTLDVTAKQHISSMAGWAMTVVTVAVIGYVISLLDVLSGRKAAAGSEDFKLGLDLSGMQVVITLIIIAIGLLINFFLYRFAVQARRGLHHLNQEQLNNSFNNLKMYFLITSVISGILLLCVLLAAVALGTGMIKP
jgi:hypothetical protein